MSLDFRPVRDAIISQIEWSLPNVKVINAHGDAERVGGVLVPYVMVSMGGPVEAAKGRGIIGPAYNPHYLWVHVHCISEDIDQAQNMKAALLVPGALVGFQPPECSMLSLVGGYQDTVVSQDTSPVRFDEALRFTVTYNLGDLYSTETFSRQVVAIDPDTNEPYRIIS